MLPRRTRASSTGICPMHGMADPRTEPAGLTGALPSRITVPLTIFPASRIDCATYPDAISFKAAMIDRGCAANP
jgi:hypothetical protein